MKKKLATCLGLLIVMVLALFGFVACGESLSLDAPQNVKYDGVAITWSKVENANGYIVTIGDKEYPVTTNRHAYIPTSADGTFTVSVKAYSDLIADKKSYSDPTEMSFRPLGTMGEITMSEEGVASWPIVDGATAYLVRYDGNDEKTVTTITPSYSEFEEGAHQIQVRPIVEGDNSYYSKWSSAKSFNFLGTVKKESIQFVNANGASRIQWGMVNGANGYQVYIGGQPYGDVVKTTQIDYETGGDTFQVSVRALGDHTYSFDGKVSDQKTFSFLGAVTNIQVKDGILSWANISAATQGYLVKVDNRETKVSTNEFDGLKSGSSRVSIKPVEYTSEDGSAQYFSLWSQELSVTILPSPVITWDSKVGFEGGLNSIIWDGVGADGYAVRVTTPSGKTDEPTNYPASQRSYRNAYDEVGTYIVEVKATTSNQDGTVSDSKYSNQIKVVRLAAPKHAANYITSTPQSVAAGFTVNYLPVEGADGYVLSQDNKEETLQNSRNETSFAVNGLVSADETNAQEFAFGIMSKGHLVNSNNGTTVYLNSADKLTFTVTTLAVPSNPEIHDYDLTFGEVAGNNGYYIDLNGKAEPSNSTTFGLESRLQPGETPVSVCAAGNGSNVLASNYTPAINVLRLAAPYDIKIARSDNSEGSLNFEGPKDYTNNFRIYFENSAEDFLVNEIENINRLIQTTNTPVHMTAEANFFDNNLKKYIMTSPDSETVTFIRLEAPTFGDKAFTNTQFIWNAPTNVNKGNFSPSYIVYNAETEQSYNGESGSTAYNIADWEGGCEYTLRVRALGNEEQNIVDSDLSVPRTIFKLATPEVMFGNGKYVWDSVDRTSSYSVYIGEELKSTLTHVSGTERYMFAPAYESPRADGYAVRVLAIGDGGATTLDSAPCAFKQVVKQLDRPDFTFAYSLEAYNATDGEIIVTITQESEHNKGYQVIIGGNANKIAEGETELRFPGAMPGSVVISAYALGGNFGEAPEGSAIPVYYCDSTPVGGTSAYTLKILGKTNQDKIAISMDNVLSWATVTDASGYEVELDVNGTKKTFTTTKASDSTELKALLNAAGDKGTRTVTVRVRAIAGTDSKKVTGEWVERIFQNI